MNNLMLFLRVYLRPGRAVSDIMDAGSWPFAVVLTLVVSALFFFTVNSKLHESYHLPALADFTHSQRSADAAAADAQKRDAIAAYTAAMERREPFPVVGDRFYALFSFEPTAFVKPLIVVSFLYIPLLVFLFSVLGNIDAYGETLRREYASLATSTLFAWSAAHLPFALLPLLLQGGEFPLPGYLGIWMASSLLFGFFMLFVLRTVLGAGFRVAAALVGIAWVSFGIANSVFSHISAWFFLIFVVAYAVIHFSGYFRRYRAFRNSVLPRQGFKRLLREIAINPSNADAHVQLALVYRRRHRPEKAIDHFRKAVEIDPNEPDANYELGKLARREGDLQRAIEHFSRVVAHDDTHSLNEVWREIGATYLAANMFGEARKALTTFIERRPFDAEGLYYLGKAVKGEGTDMEAARQIFEQAVESVRVSPVYYRRHLNHWAELAEKEI